MGMDDGVWTQFLTAPTGKDGSVVVFSRGTLGSKELGHLIRILELQRGWLVEDEAEPPTAPIPAALETEDAPAGPSGNP
jgi:hypothetical protein